MMADFFDIRTLLVASIATHAICALCIAILRHERRAHGLGAFLAGQCLSLTGLVLYAIDPSPWQIYSGVLANFLSVLSFSRLYDGLGNFLEPRAHHWPTWPLALLTLPFLVYWSWATPDTAKRVLATIGPIALFCLAMAIVTVRRSRPGELRSASPIALGYFLLAMAFFGRMFGMTNNPWAKVMDAGAPSTAATFLLSNVAMIGGTLGLTLVANRRTIERLHEARRTAERASAAKTKFLAVMSHEIRTPLNGIFGGASLILDSTAEERTRRYARTIETSCRSMLRVLDDILDFSKTESGLLELESLPFDLVSEVDSMVAAYRDVARAQGLDFDHRYVAFPSDIETVALGDALRLRQILSNLISNALKFTDEGKIEIWVTATHWNECQRHVRIEVLDTGPGIAPELRDRLFRPFRQGDSSTSRRYGGTGLGLAICRELVELMDGEIGYASRSGRGSLFWLEIPFEAPRHPQLATEPAPGSAPVPRLESPSDLENASADSEESSDEPATILVAEDNPVNRFVLSEMILALGYSVDVVEDGKQAVEAALDHPYELILMDCLMPNMDGYVATERIRQHKLASELPIIAVTAMAPGEEIERRRRAGMNDVINKPISRSDLERALALWLPRKRPSKIGGRTRPAPFSSEDRIH